MPIGLQMPPTTPAVELKDLRKSFGQLEVLKGISLQAYDGDVIAIIGGSGSGKSTLLRCINLLDIPSSGTVSVNGEAIKMKQTRHSPAPVSWRDVQRLRSRLGMVFQSFNLWQHMTILENVTEIPIQVLGIPKAAAIEQALQLLERIGLTSKKDVYPAQLSGGQQQRAAIARALAINPQVMLFDEPTSALDPELVGEVLSVIRDLAEEGRTMILVTHEMHFARDVASQVVFLHQGLIEEQGAPEQLFSQPASPRLRQFISSLY